MGCVFLYKPENLLFKTRKELEDFLKKKNVASPPYEYMVIQDEENKFIPVPAYLAAQYENATIEQKNIIESLLIRNESVVNKDEQNADTYKVVHNGKTYVLNRVSTVKKDDDYYGWQGKDDSDKFAINREWGNQVDFILTEILTHNNPELARENYNNNIENPLLSEQALNTAINLATEFLEKHGREGVLMTQVFIHNLDKAVGGRMDVVLVRPDGSIKIMDLKSSLSSTSSKDSKYSTPFISAEGKKSASKRESHAFSMSMYKAMMISQGYNVDDLEIIPWLLKEEGDIIDNIEQENIIPLDTLKPIIDEYSFDSNSEPAILYKYKSEFGKLVEDLRKKVARKLRETDKRSKQGKMLLELQRELSQDHDTIEAINNIIDDLYLMLKGGIKTYPSGKSYKQSALLTYFREIENETDPEKALNKVLEFKDRLVFYKPMIDVIKELYVSILHSEVGSVTPTNDFSPLNKLEHIGIQAAILEKEIKSKLNPLYAKVLWMQHQGDFGDGSEYKSRIDKIQRRIDRAADPKQKEKLQKELDRIKSEVITSEADLLRVLDEGTFEDLNVIDANLGAAVMSGNQLVSLFSLHIKNKLEKSRQELIQVSREAAQVLIDTVGTNSDPAVQFKGLYVDVYQAVKDDTDGKYKDSERKGFLNPIDWGKYNKAVKDMYDRANSLYSDYLTVPAVAKQRRQYINEWFRDNTESPTGFKIDGVTILESEQDIKDSLKKQLDEGLFNQNDYDYHYSRIFDENGEVRYDNDDARKFRIPNTSYKDPRYFTTTGKRRKMLDYLLKTYIEAQKEFGTFDRASTSFYLPYVPKNSTDQFFSYIKENGFAQGMVDTSKRWAKETFTIDSDRDYTHNDNHKVIPLMYSKPIPESDVSIDLLSSVLLYKRASSNYSVLKEMQRFSESYYDIIDEATVTERNVLGEVLTSKAKFREKQGQSNASKVIREYIDRIVYGETGDVNNPNMKKAATALTQFIAFTGLGGPMGLIANVANSVQASSMTLIESFGKQVFTPGSWAKAQVNVKTYFAKDAIRDAMSPVPKSIFGQLLQIYDAVQGEFMNEMGHKISQSNLKKHLHKDNWFFFQNLGELNAQYIAFDALLNDTKVKLKNGEEISLKAAYELDAKGNVKFINGIDTDSIGPVEGLVPLKVKNKLAYINKNMHGLYNKMDQAAAKKLWWGTLLLFYRNWFIPGFKRRYKRMAYNEELGDIDEGMYRTFFKALIHQHKDMWKAGFGFAKAGDFTDGERAALRKTSVELLLNALAFIMVKLLYSLAQGAGDDDDRYRIMQALVLTNRIKMELNQFIDPVDMFKLASTPTMTLSTMLNVVRLTKSLMGDVEGLGAYYILGDEDAGIQRYERDAGLWDKGDSKSAAKLFRILNYNSSRAIWTPDEVYKAQQLREL
jgi:hypothetical protein